MGTADHHVGYEQARRLRLTMEAVAIDRAELWLYYFSIGGTVSEFELDAYLNHSLQLPPLQRDTLAQAANEILTDRSPPPAPSAADLVEEQSECTEQPPATDEDDQVDRGE